MWADIRLIGGLVALITLLVIVWQNARHPDPAAKAAAVRWMTGWFTRGKNNPRKGGS